MSTYALTVYRHNHIPTASSSSSASESQCPISVDFWDTAGQERFNSMHPSYYHRAHCALLIFDTTRKITYQHLDAWYNELQQYRPGLPIMVVANKIDVDLSVTKRQFAFGAKHEHCIPNVYFVSAADGTNVVKMFKDAIRYATLYKADPSLDDFTESVMNTLDYFEQKEKAQRTQKEEEKEQSKNNTANSAIQSR